MPIRIEHLLRVTLLTALTLLSVSAAFGGILQGGTCNVAEQPAATLLFPYFEVDLDDPGGRTTLLSIVNAATATPTLAHVVLWTDWGIPTAAFDLFFGPGEVQPINLRDVFTSGSAPTSGPGAAVFDDCTDVLTPFLSSPDRLQAMHTGQPVAGGCFSAPRAGARARLATGYLTVDVVSRCSLGITLPNQSGYFGSPGVASAENRLWGDFYLVRSNEDFAQGQTAVHLVADTDRFAGPGPTFYAKFVGGSGIDARVPLPGEWRTRHLVGGPFDGGTELVVWRDVPSISSLPLPCGETPAWFPLPSQDIEVFNETGQHANIDTDSVPLATQRVSVSGLGPLFLFGWLHLDLDRSATVPAQAWVMSMISARGRYSVGQAGVRLNDPCNDE